MPMKMIYTRAQRCRIKKEQSKQKASVVSCDGNGVALGEHDIRESPDIHKLSKILVLGDLAQGCGPNALANDFFHPLSVDRTARTALKETCISALLRRR
jgi:hypothetical protein